MDSETVTTNTDNAGHWNIDDHNVLGMRNLAAILSTLILGSYLENCQFTTFGLQETFTEA